ncbi:MAG: VCBS repeat-containing protein, partial [Verrucomicrobia bacterium]|nr:VCBS repeat-containing protein [Verrucomicrobiota bacterium]
MQTESVSQPGRANASGAAAFAKRASFHLCFWILTALATQGASPFAPSLTTLPPLQGGSVAVGDFDHDGLMDIALCGLNQPIPNQTQSAQCAVWRNTGAGFVKVFEAFPQVGDASLAWVDVNNDGWLDLVISGLTGEAALVGEVWTYDGASFSKYSTLEFNLRGGPFTAVGNVCSGDFNNDGLIDLLLVANYDAFQFSYLFQNTGTGFTHLESGIEVLYYGGATVADFDNDGRLDFAVNGVAKLDTADVPRTTVVFNRESGLSPINLAPSSWDGAMASIDYNGDGREDLLLAGSFSNPYLLAPGAALWLNTPDGFQQAPINLPSFSSGMLAVVDFDNDGRSDILVCGHPSAGSDGVR